VASSISKQSAGIRQSCPDPAVPVPHGQCRDCPHHLPRDVKRGPACGQDYYKRTAAQQGLSQVSYCLQHVLAGVQNHQGPFVSQVVQRRLQRSTVGAASYCFKNGIVDQLRICHGCKINKVSLLDTELRYVGDNFKSQPGFTDSPDASQSEKALPFPQKEPEFAQLSLSTNESCQRP